MGGTFPEKEPFLNFFFLSFLVSVLKRIIAHLSSHKMPLSPSNGNINFCCILARGVMLTSSPSPGVFVCVKERLCAQARACVCSYKLALSLYIQSDSICVMGVDADFETKRSA